MFFVDIQKVARSERRYNNEYRTEQCNFVTKKEENKKNEYNLYS